MVIDHMNTTISIVITDVPVSVETQPRPAVSLPPRKNPKSFKGRSSTAHSFTSLRNPNRGRGKGLKSILPRLPIATQSSHADSQPPSSVQKEEEDSPPEKKSRSILLTAGDTYSPDTGELLPNPNNLIPLEPQFDTSLTDQPGNDEESEDNNKSQVGDMLPGIEGSRTEETSKPPPIAGKIVQIDKWNFRNCERNPSMCHAMFVKFTFVL